MYSKFIESQQLGALWDIFVFNEDSEKLIAVVLDVAFTKIPIQLLRPALSSNAAYLKMASSTREDFSKASDRIEAGGNQSMTPVPPLEDEDSAPSHDSRDVTQALYDLLASVADVDVGALRSGISIPDLGIDSLMAMEVAEEVKKFISIDISIAEFTALDDLGSLCESIANKASGYTYDSGANSKTQSDAANTTESTTNSLTPATTDTKLSSDEENIELVDLSLSHSRPISEPLDATFKAFDAIRDEFDVFAKETGCDRFWSQIYPSQASLIVSYITEAFTELGCDLSSVKADEKIPTVPHSPKHDKLMNRLSRALCDHGLINQNGPNWTRTLKRVPIPPTSREKFDQILADFPQYATEHKLLHAVGSELAGCLSGRIDAIPLLFGSSEKRKLMADQYLIAPIQSSTSQQLASFIRKCFSSRPVERTVRVLEIGGGTCGTTLYAVKAFAQLGMMVEYTFSDISSPFISAAKSKLSEYKFVKYRTLDIMEPPSDNIKSQYDMIIATNVIHATPNACESASHAREMLRPGGFLTLVEYTNYTYLLDVIFGQLDGWWHTMMGGIMH